MNALQVSGSGRRNGKTVLQAGAAFFFNGNLKRPSRDKNNIHIPRLGKKTVNEQAGNDRHDTENEYFSA